jgi:ribosomal protein S18 acetylase RimI-like enzyme
LNIAVASSPSERQQVLDLMAELSAWDRVESARLGLDAALVEAFYYAAETTDPLTPFESPSGRMLVATREDEPAGCIAYRRLDSETCEMKHLWVRPAHRGHGLARRLIADLIEHAQAAGYATMRLETAAFMTDAHALYESAGFTRRTPYYEIPEIFLPFTLFMERSLRA